MAPPVNVETQSTDKRKSWCKRFKTKFKSDKPLRKKNHAQDVVTQESENPFNVETPSKDKRKSWWKRFKTKFKSNTPLRKKNHEQDVVTKESKITVSIDKRHFTMSGITNVTLNFYNNDGCQNQCFSCSQKLSSEIQTNELNTGIVCSEESVIISETAIQGLEYESSDAQTLQLAALGKDQSNIKHFLDWPKLESQNETDNVMKDSITLLKDRAKSMHLQKVVENMPLPDPVAGHEETQPKVIAAVAGELDGELETSSYEASSVHPAQTYSSRTEPTHFQREEVEKIKDNGSEAAESINIGATKNDSVQLMEECDYDVARYLDLDCLNEDIVFEEKKDDKDELESAKPKNLAVAGNTEAKYVDKDSSSIVTTHQHGLDYLPISKTEKIDRIEDMTMNPESIDILNEEVQLDKNRKCSDADAERDPAYTIYLNRMLVKSTDTSDDENICNTHSHTIEKSDSLQNGNDEKWNDPIIKKKSNVEQNAKFAELNNGQDKRSNYFCKYCHRSSNAPSDNCFNHVHYSSHRIFKKQNGQSVQHGYESVRGELKKPETTIAYRSSTCDSGVFSDFASTLSSYTRSHEIYMISSKECCTTDKEDIHVDAKQTSSKGLLLIISLDERYLRDQEKKIMNIVKWKTSSWSHFTPDCRMPCIYPVFVPYFDPHRRTPYIYEWVRLQSFDQYSGNGSGIVLARNGFYHDSNDGPTSTTCYSCNATCSDWENNVSNAAEHHIPDCPHLNNSNSGNIPINCEEEDVERVSYTAASQAGRGNDTATSATDETTAMTAAGDTSTVSGATHNNIPVAMLSMSIEQTSVQSQNTVQTQEETSQSPQDREIQQYMTSFTGQRENNADVPEHRSVTSTRQQTEATNANCEPTTISQPVNVSEPAAISQPVTVSESAAISQPVTVSESAAISQPLTVSEPAAISQPVTVSESAAISQPVTVSESAAISQPLTVSEPAAISQLLTVSEPAAISQPLTASEPAAISQPVTVSESAAISQPLTVSEPAAISQPLTVSESAAISQPLTVSEPAAISQPVTVSEPAAISQPVTVSESAAISQLLTVSEPAAISQLAVSGQSTAAALHDRPELQASAQALDGPCQLETTVFVQTHPELIHIDQPRHRDYSTVDSRAATFTGSWPDILDLTPRRMAEAGFFYIGKADFTRCFACGGGLRSWEPGDDPVIEHARWYPACPYINRLKGEQYMKAKMMLQQQHLEERERQQMAFSRQRATQPHDPLRSTEASALVDILNRLDRVRQDIVEVRRQTAQPHDPLRSTEASALVDILNRLDRVRQDIVEVRRQTAQPHDPLRSTEASALVDILNRLDRVRQDIVEVRRQTASQPIDPSIGSTSSSTAPKTLSTTSGSTCRQTAAAGNQPSEEDQQSSSSSVSSEAAGNQLGATGGADPSNAENLYRQTLWEENQRLHDRLTCKICLDRPVDMTFIPCGHLCCGNCARKLLPICPICKSRITKVVWNIMS